MHTPLYPLTPLLALLLAVPVHAQQLDKMDGALSALVQQQRKGRAVRTAPINVAVHTTDADAVAAVVAAEGYTSHIVRPTLIAVDVPVEFLPTLAALDEVEHLRVPQQYHPFLTEARSVSRVDEVHRGEGLETPFTGKDVVIGVIDQGFEYRHLAFLDAQGDTRVKSVWNRSLSLDTKPLTTIPAMGDKGSGGHATHVTNIAAGSEVGNGLHGVAPEADIIMIPTQFVDYEVLEDVEYIKRTAEAEGKPWVVNMSFGTQVGPHDGTSGYSREIDALTGRGGIIVGAMGNEGELPIHASAELAPGDVRYILCKGGLDAYLLVDFWANDADGQRHFRVTPLTYTNYRVAEHDEAFWEGCTPQGSAVVLDEVNRANQKQHLGFTLDVEKVAESLSTSYAPTKSIVGFKIELLEGETEPRTFHMWTHETYGAFSTVAISGQDGKMLRPDSNYLCGEGAASIPSAVAVAAYNSCSTFTSLPTGAMYDTSRFCGPLYAVSSFSSPGPWLGSGTQKPLVAAPGAVIKSAWSKLVDTFAPDDQYVVDVVEAADGKKFYYSVMQGTSMATPFVSGAIALWLEANPMLDYRDIERIIRETSVVDDAIAADYPLLPSGNRSEWSPRAGYGRLDVYAGLKRALQMGDSDGILRVENSERPVTLQPTQRGWNVLFNNRESQATIRVHAADGRLLEEVTLADIRQGTEHRIDLSRHPAGAYLISITTPRSTTTRRVMRSSI